MSRVLALVGAILLISAAILARAVLTDDDGGGGDDDGDEALVVVCIPELREACEAIDRPMTLTIEDPGATIERLAAGEEIDAWVTFDPWPAMAEVLDQRAAVGDHEAVARTDLLVLARSASVPDPGCEDLVTWTCLVAGLGDRVAVPDPGTALGVLVLGQAATDFFGGPFATNDLTAPALADRLAELDVADDPLGDMRIGLPEPAATGVLAVDLDQLGARRSDFTDSPSGGAPATVAIVVAGPDGDRIAGEPSFTAALEDLGWTLDPGAATAGLPNAGVLVALQGTVG